MAEMPFAIALWSVKYQDVRELRARTFLAFSFQLLKLFSLSVDCMKLQVEISIPVREYLTRFTIQ